MRAGPYILQEMEKNSLTIQYKVHNQKHIGSYADGFKHSRTPLHLPSLLQRRGTSRGPAEHQQMPLRLPPLQPHIHPLPSLLTSSPLAQTLPICSLCHQRTSPYTCPTCNIPYCSLKCFTDERKHAGCLATFRGKAEDDLRETSRLHHEADAQSADDQVKDAERRNLLDLLRSYQAEQDEGEGVIDLHSLMELAASQDDTGESEDEDATYSQLTEANLPSSTPALLAMLNRHQRDTFFAAVGQQQQQHAPHASIPTPESSRGAFPNEAKARKLWEKIVQDEHRKADVDPQANLWWLTDSLPSHFVANLPSFEDQVMTLKDARQSKAMSPPAIGLAWNCIALLTSYTYVLLHLEIPSFSSLLASHHAKEQDLIVISLSLLQRLAPYLFAMPAHAPSSSSSYSPPSPSSEANLLLDGPSSVTTYFLARLGDRDRSLRPGQLLLEVYAKTASLVCQPRISETVPSQAHPSASRAHKALGDIWFLIDYALTHPTLLEASVTSPCSKKRPTPSQTKRSFLQARRKLAFYSAMCASSSVDSSSTLLSSTSVLGSLTPSAPQDALSSLCLVERGENVRPHRIRREAKTLQEEMEVLQEEVKALEDEERWEAARRVEEERSGGRRERERVKKDAIEEISDLVESVNDGQPSHLQGDDVVCPSWLGTDEVHPAPPLGETDKVEKEAKRSSFAERRLARQRKERQSRKPVEPVALESEYGEAREEHVDAA